MSEPRQWKTATCLAICFLFSRMSWRIALKRQRREGSFVSILCTVISKTCRPIGVQKTLGYCKSLDCVAGVLRRIGQSENGKGKPALRPPFSFLLPFPFTPLPLPSFCTYHAGYCEIYIFTLTWLWFVCSTVRIRIAVHLWTCSTRMTSLWTVVMPLCRTAIARRYYKLIAWMLSRLGGDLVECCFIILFLYWLNM